MIRFGMTKDDVNVGILILLAGCWQVITAQYFVWFFCLLPLILSSSNMKLKWKGLGCIILWVGAQLHWLMWGYLLEFKGKNVFLQLWIASILFLAANTYLLVSVIHHHKYAPIFARVENKSDGARKLQWWNKYFHALKGPHPLSTFGQLVFLLCFSVIQYIFFDIIISFHLSFFTLGCGDSEFVMVTLTSIYTSFSFEFDHSCWSLPLWLIISN